MPDGSSRAITGVVDGKGLEAFAGGRVGVGDDKIQAAEEQQRISVLHTLPMFMAIFALSEEATILLVCSMGQGGWLEKISTPP